MRLKDIFCPWGRIKVLERTLDTAIASLERQAATRVLDTVNRLTNIEYGARQRDIAANLRSECLRLHEEIFIRDMKIEINELCLREIKQIVELNLK